MQRAKRKLFIFVLTLVRIPLAITFAIILNYNDFDVGVTLILFGILSLVELTDILDGILARRFSIVSELGATLDPYADSISRLIIYSGFAFKGIVFPILPLVMAIRDITVAYSRIILAANGHTVSAKWSGKKKALFQAIGGFILVLLPLYPKEASSIVTNVVSWVLIIVTTASSIEYIKSALSSMKE